MNRTQIREFLDAKVEQYHHTDFLSGDPVQIPHMFRRKEDIEISGFLTSVISWGNRKSIIHNATRMMDLMGNAPYEFVMGHGERDLEKLESFVHRTFQGVDFVFFIRSLQMIYKQQGGLETVFSSGNEPTLQPNITGLKQLFFSIPHPARTTKHLPDPSRGSAAKRINMFLRWMVRDASRGVDFGIWKDISPSRLSCPLDVHSGRVARKLGLLKRKMNDAKAVAELDSQLRLLDPMDPVKYDFALFGLGVNENW